MATRKTIVIVNVNINGTEENVDVRVEHEAAGESQLQTEMVKREVKGHSAAVEKEKREIAGESESVSSKVICSSKSAGKVGEMPKLPHWNLLPWEKCDLETGKSAAAIFFDKAAKATSDQRKAKETVEKRELRKIELKSTEIEKIKQEEKVPLVDKRATPVVKRATGPRMNLIPLGDTDLPLAIELKGLQKLKVKDEKTVQIAKEVTKIESQRKEKDPGDITVGPRWNLVPFDDFGETFNTFDSTKGKNIETTDYGREFSKHLEKAKQEEYISPADNRATSVDKRATGPRMNLIPLGDVDLPFDVDTKGLKEARGEKVTMGETTVQLTKNLTKVESRPKEKDPGDMTVGPRWNLVPFGDFDEAFSPFDDANGENIKKKDFGRDFLKVLEITKQTERISQLDKRATPMDKMATMDKRATGPRVNLIPLGDMDLTYDADAKGLKPPKITRGEHVVVGETALQVAKVVKKVEGQPKEKDPGEMTIGPRWNLVPSGDSGETFAPYDAADGKNVEAADCGKHENFKIVEAKEKKIRHPEQNSRKKITLKWVTGKNEKKHHKNTIARKTPCSGETSERTDEPDMSDYEQPLSKMKK